MKWDDGLIFTVHIMFPAVWRIEREAPASLSAFDISGSSRRRKPPEIAGIKK